MVLMKRQTSEGAVSPRSTTSKAFMKRHISEGAVSSSSTASTSSASSFGSVERSNYSHTYNASNNHSHNHGHGYGFGYGHGHGHGQEQGYGQEYTNKNTFPKPLQKKRMSSMPAIRSTSRPLSNTGADSNNTSSSFSSYPTDTKLHTTSKKGSLPSTLVWKLFIIIQYIAFFITLCYSCILHSKLSKNVELLSDITEKRNTLYESYLVKEDELRQTNEDFTHLSLLLNSVSHKPQHPDNVRVESEIERKIVTETVIGRTDAQKERIDSMKLAIQEYDLKYLDKK